MNELIFEKLADFIMKRAKLIVVLWIIILLCAVPFALQSGSVMQYDMTKMSSSTPMESVEGSKILASGEFNNGTNINGGTIILIEALDAQSSNVLTAMNKSLEDGFYFWDQNKQLRETYGPDYQITVKLLGSFDDKYFKDKDTDMIMFTVSCPTLPDGKTIKGTNLVPEIREIVSQAKAGVDGIEGTYVTGNDAISYDTMTGAVDDIKKIDPISILLILILIGLFFRSFVTAMTPPVVIGVAFAVTLAGVFFIGSVIGIFYLATILVLVSMLGAGCDYGIFIVSRYREERKEGKNHDDALRESIIWAGESIMVSGISVIIGFGSLSLCSFSLVSTMGIVLALGIVMALLAALTLIPSILMLVGDRIFWPTRVSSYREGSKVMNGWYGKCAAFGHRYFTSSAKASIKYAKVIFVAAILLTVPLAYVAVTNEPSYDMIGSMSDGEAKQGVGIISENLGGGLIMPTNVTMEVDAFVDVQSDVTIKSGDVVQKGSIITYTAKPYTGYTVTGWIVDGVYEASTEDSRQEEAGKEVKVVYAPSEYEVKYDVKDSAGGKISASTNGQPIVSGNNVSYGATVKFTATPDAGYRVDHWIIYRNSSVFGETVYSHDNELEIDCASYDYKVTVCFGKEPTQKYTVTVNTTGSGSVVARADGTEFKSGSQVYERSHIKLSALPETGYSFVKWVVGDKEVTDTTYEFDISADTTISAVFEKVVKKEYTVTFSSSGEGSLTASVDGKTIKSGDKITEGSYIVFTASPKDGYKVGSWTYNGQESVISKTQHTISYLSKDTSVDVKFEKNETTYVTLTYQSAGDKGTLTATVNGKIVESGSSIPKGSDVNFTVTPATVTGLFKTERYCVSSWMLGTNESDVKKVDTTSESISVHSVSDNVYAYVNLDLVDQVALVYSTNNDDYGKITASIEDTSAAYVERANASSVYAALDSFAQTLMSLKTDGTYNVAVAIGPMSGDMLFDGTHEWVFDTIKGLLPTKISSMIDLDKGYDYLVSLWNGDKLTYEAKQYFNYLLTYKLGFVSSVFTDKSTGEQHQYVKFMVMTKDEPMSSLSVNTIKQIYGERDAFVSQYDDSKENGFVHTSYLSGAAVSNYEISQLVSSDFHFIIVIVIILLLLLLFIVMKSYLTPIRAVFTIVMSVLWTLGLTYILFQDILGLPVVWIVPIVLFVVCLGLGMDYDILLTTRIKECVSKGMSNDEAIVAAVQKSGAVITLCGLIMAGAFSAMMLSTSPMLVEFGFALGFAIAIDALVVRTYIVPAIMHLMGDWNWKGPNYGKFREWRAKRRAKYEEE